MKLITSFYLPTTPHTTGKDNDMYGHVNNAVYYSFFDTCVNHFLINAAIGKRCHRTRDRKSMHVQRAFGLPGNPRHRPPRRQGWQFVNTVGMCSFSGRHGTKRRAWVLCARFREFCKQTHGVNTGANPGRCDTTASVINAGMKYKARRMIRLVLLFETRISPPGTGPTPLCISPVYGYTR